MSDGPRLRVSFPEEGIAAVAVLDTERAPQTVAGVLAAMPRQGEGLHGIYSGSEIYVLLEPGVWLEPEHATAEVRAGDLAYGRVVAGRHDGFPDDLSELLWFYDNDATPSMPDGPMPVNVFGRFEEGWEAFAVACRDMRRSGAKRVRFEVDP